MYNNYNCRTCVIRDRCIEQSSNASSIKLMLYNAFENRTDTLATWKRLREECLIEKEAKAELEAQHATGSGLSKRLKRAQESRQKRQMTDTVLPTAQTFGYIGLEEVGSRIKQDSQKAEAVSQLKYKHMTMPLKASSPARTGQSTTTNSFWLTIEGTWRHITLPDSGSLVLGRFDPNVGVPPDIDLSFEDQQTHLVSRRHALIVSKNGTHSIEDLGSISGVYLNDKKLSFGPSPQLKPGDRIRLGKINLIFEEIPAVVFSAVNQEWTRHTLTITATGEKFIINAQNAVMIGRGDRNVNFTPDLDLGRCGRMAQRVSRRHARILWQNGRPYVEDMGSGFGTRLRGKDLPLGKPMPLAPGDHIWLAGCVLAYDIEIAPAMAAQPAIDIEFPVGAYSV